MKEDRVGNRYPLARDGRAVIRSENGMYTGIINDDEVIAVSNDVQTVYERLKHADKDIEITIAKGRQTFKDIDSYLNTYLPRIYRITYSDTKAHGLIIAIDDYKNGNYSTIRLFYSFDKVVEYVTKRQRNDGNYFVYTHRFFDAEILEKLGGIDALDVPRDMATVKHLRQAIEDRQKAGSHEAYIDKVRRETNLIRHGKPDTSGEDPHPDDFID